MMFRPLALLSGIALFTSVARGAYLDVNVSNENGDLNYYPSQLVSQKANKGDIVRFHFVNEVEVFTVTQSSLDHPCTPLSGGFDSGYMTADGLNGENPFEVYLSGKGPYYVFCEVGSNDPHPSHCQKGMVMTINGDYTKFREKAENTYFLPG
ncbi:hypothetical protein V8E53_010670 [Lactarius tabidus]